MLHEASGEHSLSWTVVSEWHSRFKAGQVSVEDEVNIQGTKRQQNDRKC
jgi:hypothetical protein